jgi:hypothetical protein
MTPTPATSTTETRIAAGEARMGGIVVITGAGTATVVVGTSAKEKPWFWAVNLNSVLDPPQATAGVSPE